MQGARALQPSRTNRPRPSAPTFGRRAGPALPTHAFRACAVRPPGRPRAPEEEGHPCCERPSRAGGFGGGGTPGPVPNPEVKPASAEGTAGATPRETRAPPAREARSQAGGLPASPRWASCAPRGRAALAAGAHPVPSRTRKLSPPAPRVLRGRPRGRPGRRPPPWRACRRGETEGPARGPFCVRGGCSRESLQQETPGHVKPLIGFSAKMVCHAQSAYAEDYQGWSITSFQGS